MNNSTSISIRILSKEFKVHCPSGSEEQLMEAAQYLDLKMRDIRNSGRVLDIERIAIMAALNMAHELLTSRQYKEAYVESISNHIQYLQKKLDGVLMESDLLEEGI